MVELLIDMGDGSAEAYVARPETDQAVPGVLLFMDAIGLRPQIRRIAQRIADWGYVVLAPNVFFRSGTAAETTPTTDLRDPEERARYFSVAKPRLDALTSDLSRPDTTRYLEALAGQPGVDSARPVGVVGYCMGVRLALRAAGDHPDRVAAVAGFHGGALVTDQPDSPHLSLATARAQVMLRHADNDASMTREHAAAIADIADQYGVRVDQAVYADAPHGYAMADTSSYHAAAAEKHFQDMKDHFSAQL